VRWHGVNGGNDHDTIHLFGSEGANTITGSSENDIIQGFGGADILNGGDGNDTFVYAGTDQLVAGEVVNGGSGTDTLVVSSGLPPIAFDFTIATLSSIEALEFFAAGTRSATFTDTQFEGKITTLTGAGEASDDTVIINGTDSVVDVSALTFVNWNDARDSITINGTANQDLLIGSAHRDTLNGGGNNDLLLGGLGDDTLDGGAGNDVLTGAGGNDTMIGGPGDDNYTVQDVGDVVSENVNEGTDTVNASITFSLAALANVENLTLTGSANINGTGNSGVNTITGNSGNNTLDGRGGNDTLDGGLGDDTLIGNGGIDTASYLSHDGVGLINFIDLGLGSSDGSYSRFDLVNQLLATGRDGRAARHRERDRLQPERKHHRQRAR
jgi:Ca2+-binding RTX toxin-like protein